MAAWKGWLIPGKIGHDEEISLEAAGLGSFPFLGFCCLDSELQA